MASNGAYEQPEGYPIHPWPMLAMIQTRRRDMVACVVELKIAGGCSGIFPSTC